MTDEECAPLRVCDTGEALLSCWRLTWRERLAVLLGGRLWLWIIGRGHPPVSLQVESPFTSRAGDDSYDPDDRSGP